MSGHAFGVGSGDCAQSPLVRGPRYALTECKDTGMVYAQVRLLLFLLFVIVVGAVETLTWCWLWLVPSMFASSFSFLFVCVVGCRGRCQRYRALYGCALTSVALRDIHVAPVAAVDVGAGGKCDH